MGYHSIQKAIHLLEKQLEKNPDKLDWYWLSRNPNVIHLLEKNPEKINWSGLSQNPNAIHLLEKNPGKISWYWLSSNPSIFEIDQEQYKKDLKGCCASALTIRR